MKNCIFCKIVKKEIPAYIVAENKNAIAFLDINPIADGHTVIISKKHYPDWQHTPKEVMVDIIALSYEVIDKIDKGLKPFGYNYISNQGAIANQVIFHFHLHIVPKYYENQGFKANRIDVHVQSVEKVYKKLVKKPLL